MEFYTAVVYALTYLGLFIVSFYVQNMILYRKKEPLIKEKTDKTVTVIIPAYNEEKSIAQTIESIRDINYPKEKLEILVIDDGSRDKTYEIAKKYASTENPKIKIITKKNGGKGSALNLGIKEASNGIVITMDADTFVQKDAVRKMIAHFTNDDVTAVTPAMGVFKAHSVWQRVQQIEYYLGVFLRKNFATINAIHVTPGAFSAYRKSFFEKYGGYDEQNITEDLEIALRIQSKELAIENEPEAVVYTVAPTKFGELLIQRKRWYIGLIKNIWAYRRLMGPKRGAFGTIVLPMAIITIFTGIFLTGYTLIRTIDSMKNDINSLRAINFQFEDTIEINRYMVENTLLRLLSDKVLIITVLFIVLLACYLYYAKKKMLYQESLKVNFILFVFLFGILFSIWWIVSFIHMIFNRKVAWRKEPKEIKNDG